MSIFTTVAMESAIAGTLVGGATLIGVTADAAFRPEFGGDSKDYSQTISTSANIGMNLAMAYLGIKYVNKGVGAIRAGSFNKQVPIPTNATAAQARLAQMVGQRV